MRKIFLLAIAMLSAVQVVAQQPATMIVKLANGATVRTDVSEVEKITFADTLFNLNNTGYRKPTSFAGPKTACCPASFHPLQRSGRWI